jgi:hypothetical protein
MTRDVEEELEGGGSHTTACESCLLLLLFTYVFMQAAYYFDPSRPAVEELSSFNFLSHLLLKMLL